MTIENERDLQGILRIGQICGAALQHMLARIEPGMTTAELDAIGAAYSQRAGRALGADPGVQVPRLDASASTRKPRTASPAHA